MRIHSGYLQPVWTFLWFLHETSIHYIFKYLFVGLSRVGLTRQCSHFPHHNTERPVTWNKWMIFIYSPLSTQWNYHHSPMTISLIITTPPPLTKETTTKSESSWNLGISHRPPMRAIITLVHSIKHSFTKVLKFIYYIIFYYIVIFSPILHVIDSRKLVFSYT